MARSAPRAGDRIQRRLDPVPAVTHVVAFWQVSRPRRATLAACGETISLGLVTTTVEQVSCLGCLACKEEDE